MATNMFMVTLFGLLTFTYGYDRGQSFGTPDARRICQDMRASYDMPEGADFHGDPEGTDPENFANFTISRLSENLWNITLELYEDVEDSLAGWIFQVRPYGVGDLYTALPVGVVESVSNAASEYWLCPDASGVDEFTRNGIVHSNGEANKLANLRSVSFTWAAVPSAYPECARVVASVMTANDLWYWTMESECFMSVQPNGDIGECDFPQCDPRDPGEPPEGLYRKKAVF